MILVVDIDGTIALRNGREAFDWDHLDTDVPNAGVIELVRSVHNSGHQILFISGRHEKLRQPTQEWLDFHVLIPGQLLMRRNGDTRPDDVIKEEILLEYVSDLSEILAVLDDRNRVVRMWREKLNLLCLQVAEGNF